MRLSQLNDDTILERIVKKGKGYGVISKTGKNLGSKNKDGTPMSKAQAHKRLGQVEYFKKHKK